MVRMRDGQCHELRALKAATAGAALAAGMAGFVALAISHAHHGCSFRKGMERLGAGLEKGLKGGAHELRLGMSDAAAGLCCRQGSTKRGSCLAGGKGCA